jgi:hypothetical protein
MRRPVLVPPSFAMLAMLVAAALVAASGSGCTDATGSVQGGQALTTCSGGGSASGSNTSFSSLYTDFFGPCGGASCSGQSACHGAADQTGAILSGFVCGTTKDACWQGMTQGIALSAGGSLCPIVCLGTCAQVAPDDGGPPPSACPTNDPASQLLVTSLHKQQSTGINHMPCGDPTACTAAKSTYTFTPDDVARITAWIQAGAQND